MFIASCPVHPFQQTPQVSLCGTLFFLPFVLVCFFRDSWVQVQQETLAITFSWSPNDPFEGHSHASNHVSTNIVNPLCGRIWCIHGCPIRQNAMFTFPSNVVRGLAVCAHSSHRIISIKHQHQSSSSFGIANMKPTSLRVWASSRSAAVHCEEAVA